MLDWLRHRKADAHPADQERQAFKGGEAQKTLLRSSGENSLPRWVKRQYSFLEPQNQGMERKEQTVSGWLASQPFSETEIAPGETNEKTYPAKGEPAGNRLNGKRHLPRGGRRLSTTCLIDQGACGKFPDNPTPCSSPRCEICR